MYAPSRQRRTVDGYKSQCLPAGGYRFVFFALFTGCSDSGQLFCSGAVFPDRSAPVSYTHLDVYKRQLHEQVTAVVRQMTTPP